MSCSVGHRLAFEDRLDFRWIVVSAAPSTRFTRDLLNLSGLPRGANVRLRELRSSDINVHAAGSNRGVQPAVLALWNGAA